MDLLSQIQKGAQLRHVDEDKTQATTPPEGRDALLDQIRKGRALNKVNFLAIQFMMVDIFYEVLKSCLFFVIELNHYFWSS